MNLFEVGKSGIHSSGSLKIASEPSTDFNDLSRFNYRSNTANNTMPGAHRAARRVIPNL